MVANSLGSLTRMIRVVTWMICNVRIDTWATTISAKSEIGTRNWKSEIGMMNSGIQSSPLRITRRTAVERIMTMEVCTRMLLSYARPTANEKKALATKRRGYGFAAANRQRQELVQGESLSVLLPRAFEATPLPCTRPSGPSPRIPPQKHALALHSEQWVMSPESERYQSGASLRGRARYRGQSTLNHDHQAWCVHGLRVLGCA